MSIPRKVLLASDDLNARARVEAAAPRGTEIAWAGPTRFVAQVADADLVIIDLDRGRDEALAEVVALLETSGAALEVVGFLSHVDGDLARAARAAGCRPVARGRFWALLPELLAVRD